MCKNFQTSYVTQKDHYRAHECSLVSILSQINSVLITQSYFSMIHFNIIPTSTSWSFSALEFCIIYSKGLKQIPNRCFSIHNNLPIFWLFISHATLYKARSVLGVEILTVLSTKNAVSWDVDSYQHSGGLYRVLPQRQS